MHVLKVIAVCIFIVAVVIVGGVVLAFNKAESDGENPFQ